MCPIKSPEPERLTLPADDGWMTGVEVQEHLKVGSTVLRSLVTSGELPAYKIGGRFLRYKRSEVDGLGKRQTSARDGFGVTE